MTLLGCDWIREQLPAYHDKELGVSEQIVMRSHLEICAGCSGEARRLRAVTEAVRLAAAYQPGLEPDAGFRASIIGRISAERHESFPAKFGRMFEDAHLLWAGLGATVAALICAVLTVVLVEFAVPERIDSLAGTLSVLSSPGSNENPVRLDSQVTLPTVYAEGVMPSILSHPAATQEDVVVAFAGVLTREGRLTELEVLPGVGHDDHIMMVHLVSAAAGARFRPAARVDGTPVAVNMVWLFAHTTVHGKITNKIS